MLVTTLSQGLICHRAKHTYT